MNELKNYETTTSYNFFGFVLCLGFLFSFLIIRYFVLPRYRKQKIRKQIQKTLEQIENGNKHFKNELEQYNHKEISREEIIKWVDKHQKLFKLFELPPLFYKHQDAFYECYSHIKKVVEFLEMEDKALNALQQFKTLNINNELELLKWLVNHENLQYQLILLHPNIVPEEALITGKIKLYNDFNIYFKKELLQNCINLDCKIVTSYFFKYLCPNSNLIIDQYCKLQKK